MLQVLHVISLVWLRETKPIAALASFPFPTQLSALAVGKEWDYVNVKEKVIVASHSEKVGPEYEAETYLTPCSTQVQS